MRWVVCSLVLFVLPVSVRAADTLKGTFKATVGGEKISIKFDEKGKFTVTLKDTELVVGTFKIEGDKVEFKDEKGPAMEEGPGKYTFKLDGKKLTFTKVEDKGEGRAKALTGQPWEMDK